MAEVQGSCCVPPIQESSLRCGHGSYARILMFLIWKPGFPVTRRRWYNGALCCRLLAPLRLALGFYSTYTVTLYRARRSLYMWIPVMYMFTFSQAKS